MNNFKYRLANFMRGRYGMDALYRALMAGTVILLVLHVFFPSPVLYLLSLACTGYAFFRAFSKNHARRAAENQKYLALRSAAGKKLLQARNRFRDRRTHRYRACPHCRQMLRLTRKIGVNHIKGPKCQHEFDLNIRF